MHALTAASRHKTVTDTTATQQPQKHTTRQGAKLNVLQAVNYEQHERLLEVYECVMCVLHVYVYASTLASRRFFFFAAVP